MSKKKEETTTTANVGSFVVPLGMLRRYSPHKKLKKKKKKKSKVLTWAEALDQMY